MIFNFSRELSQLQKDLPDKEKNLQKAQDHLKVVKGNDVSVANDLRKYQAQLEEKKSSMMANRSQNRVLNFIMKLKMEGKVNGIFGRLVSRIGNPEKPKLKIPFQFSPLNFFSCREI